MLLRLSSMTLRMTPATTGLLVRVLHVKVSTNNSVLQTVDGCGLGANVDDDLGDCEDVKKLL